MVQISNWVQEWSDINDVTLFIYLKMNNYYKNFAIGFFISLIKKLISHNQNRLSYRNKSCWWCQRSQKDILTFSSFYSFSGWWNYFELKKTKSKVRFFFPNFFSSNNSKIMKTKVINRGFIPEGLGPQWFSPGGSRPTFGSGELTFGS